MPFTFSHPAVVIPIAKRKIILSAAIIGSMAPDFEYFLRLSTRSHYGHTFPGIFFFSLPVAFFILWLFHSFIKKPAISLLPVSFQSRLAQTQGKFDFFPLSRFALIIISLLIGIFSHIAWDSLTHLDGFVVKNVYFLRTKIPVLNHHFAVFFLLQQVSTVIGILAITGFVTKWYRNAPKQKIISIGYLSDGTRGAVILTIMITATALGVLYSSISFDLLDSLTYISHVTGRTVVYTISFLFIVFLIYSAFWHLKFARYDKD